MRTENHTCTYHPIFRKGGSHAINSPRKIAIVCCIQVDVLSTFERGSSVNVRRVQIQVKLAPNVDEVNLIIKYEQYEFPPYYHLAQGATF